MTWKYSITLSGWEHVKNEYFEEDINAENDDEEQYKSDFISHVCNICQKVYQSKTSLSTHIKSVHEKNWYPCDQCQYKATEKERNIFSLSMKRSSIFVINVANNLQDKAMWRDIFCLSMKESSITVINVVNNLHNKDLLRHIFSLSIKKSSILVINVTNTLQNKDIWRRILNLFL